VSVALFDVGQDSLSGFDAERDALVGENELVTGVGESQIPVLEPPVFPQPTIVTPV
jgi:hypothetical protein